jgi:hypothetical protein
MQKVLKNNKYGFLNASGQLAVPLAYDAAAGFQNGLAAVVKYGKVGYIDKTNHVVIPFEYDYGSDFSNGYAVVIADKKAWKIDKTGRQVSARKYDDIAVDRDYNYIPVSMNKKWGYINPAGREIIPIEYDDIQFLYDGLVGVKKGNKWAYADTTGRIVIPFDFEKIGGFVKGYAIVGNNTKMWKIDKTGRQTTFRKYDNIKPDGDNGLVSLDQKWGYINVSGKEIVPPEYDSIQYLYEGLLAVQKGNKWGYIDTTDQVVLPFEFEEASVFRNDRAIVKKDGKVGTIDKNGKNMISFNYQSMYYDASTGWYNAQKKDKVGMIDRRGKEMIPFEFDDIHYFSKINEGYAVVEINKKWGMIDQQGKLVIPARYDSIFDCKEGYCFVTNLVGNDDKFGIVSYQNGTELIPPQYNGVGNIYEGLAVVKKGFNDSYLDPARYGFANISGKEITPLKYEQVQNFSNGMAAVKLNGKWGFVNNEGKEVIFPRYEAFVHFENEKAVVQEDGNIFYIDKKGRLSEIPENEKKNYTAILKAGFPNQTGNTGKTGNQYYVLATTKKPQIDQLVLTSKTFPRDLISQYWKSNYEISDLTIAGANLDTYVLVMAKNNFSGQSWITRNTDTAVITDVREKYKITGKRITYLGYLNKEWVVVYSSGTVYGAQTVSPARTPVFPESWVNSKWKDGYFITSMAFGNGGWLVVMTKGANYLDQKLITADQVDELLVGQKKQEGYIITDLVQNDGKNYIVFSKVADPGQYHQNKIPALGTKVLENMIYEGATLLRNIHVAGQ